MPVDWKPVRNTSMIFHLIMLISWQFSHMCLERVYHNYSSECQWCYLYQYLVLLEQLCRLVHLVLLVQQMHVVLQVQLGHLMQYWFSWVSQCMYMYVVRLCNRVAWPAWYIWCTSSWVDMVVSVQLGCLVHVLLLGCLVRLHFLCMWFYYTGAAGSPDLLHLVQF